MRIRYFSLMLVAFSAAWAAASANAGTLSLSQFSNDLTSGISPSITYTHLVDLNSNDGGATINTVVFGTAGSGGGGLTGANYSLVIPDSLGDFDGHDSPAPNTDGIDDLLDDFYHVAGASAGSEVLTLTGLTPGVQYKLRLYVSGSFGGATQAFTFDDTLVPTLVSAVPRGAGASGSQVGSVDYLYTLGAGDTDLIVSINADADGDSFHQYGFSNEVVPEPSSFVLLTVGLAGLAGLRRRSRVS